MPVAPSKICLRKTLKQGLRRCVYRRWDAAVKGKLLITKTIDLERMYRGNTPYPIGKIRRTTKLYASKPEATHALKLMCSRRRSQGYRVIKTN